MSGKSPHVANIIEGTAKSRDEFLREQIMAEVEEWEKKYNKMTPAEQKKEDERLREEIETRIREDKIQMEKNLADPNWIGPRSNCIRPRNNP